MVLITYLNVVLFSVLLAYSLVRKKLLLALYVVCYSVPFLGLAGFLWSDKVVLWPVGEFEFASDSSIAYRLSIVWLLGCLGAVFGCVISPALPKVKYFFFKSKIYSPGDYKSGSLFFLVSASSLIFIRFLSPDNMVDAFSGVESFVVFSIVAFFTRALVYPSVKVSLVALLLIFSYSLANALTGDRDFIVLSVACILGYFFRHHDSINFKSFFAAGFFLVCLLVIGVIISMYRMSVDFSADSLTQFLSYNSWNAIILPLVEQVSLRWDEASMRYGQTYLDMLLSLGPSPIYTVFGLEKPITTDNPASWYYIFGLGGIHVAGVAFENFGLYGVFINGLISVCFLHFVDSRCRIDDFLHVFLYILCAASVMHWIWYGEMYLLNALVFYVMSLGIILMIKLFRGLVLISLSTEQRE